MSYFTTTRRLALCACLASILPCTQAFSDPQADRASLGLPKYSAVSAAEARQIAEDAYVFGYPLVTMEMTRRVVTNVDKPTGKKAPMGQLLRMREYPNAAFRDVTAPNADTLYTTGFMDLGKEPYVLSLPDAQGRYYLMPMLDGWTNVFQVPGKRTTGTGPQKYVITGPNWKGTLPAGLTEYKSQTDIVWLLGRIYCTGTPEDYTAVHKMQDRVSIVPLSAYGKAYTPPHGKVDPTIDMKTPVRDQVNGMSVDAYFTLLAKLMKTNPATAADAPIVEKMARLGIVPGQTFESKQLNAEAAAAIQSVPADANKKIQGYFADVSAPKDGWTFTTHTGLYGTNYLNRALITAFGLGANRPQDAVYPTAETDKDGKPFDGSKSYVMHFKKGELPPVAGFWSLTMYNAQYFFTENALNRYNVSSRSPFKVNADGSTDIYIQHASPGADKEANWLPAPKDRFILMLRMYWPKETPPSIIDGTWSIPGVEAVG